MHGPKKNDKQLSDQWSIFALTSGVITVDMLTNSICGFIRCIIRNEEALEYYSKLTSPIVAIMSSQHVVLSTVVQKISDWFQTLELTKFEQKNVLLILVQWLKDPRLTDAMKGYSPSMSVREQIHEIGCSQVIRENELAHGIVSIMKALQ
eukprot:jgi/Psemu1/312167/fgenesh1_kg.893_\